MPYKVKRVHNSCSCEDILEKALVDLPKDSIKEMFWGNGYFWVVYWTD